MNNLIFLSLVLPILFFSRRGQSEEKLNIESSSAFMKSLYPSLHFLNKTLPLSEKNRFFEQDLLAKIISEPEGGTIHSFIANVQDDGAILSLERKSKDSKQVIPGEEFISSEVVLARADNKKALMVSCLGCSLNFGGELTLHYLYNGVSMDYKKLKLKIAKNRSGYWKIYTLNDVEVKNLKLVSRKIFGRLVGIKEIRVNP
tara:strand:+ start:791 stop:1393 length:603 start_codon:yes stop_codon:yes gene_type:complete